MSNNNIDLNDIIEAVAEDPNLQPIEKETTIFWTKDGSPTIDATGYDCHVAKVYTEEAGLSRRLLQHPHFTGTQLRVNDSGREGRRIEPHNFSGGIVTGVGGYVPINSMKIQKSMRSTTGHADVAPYRRSPSGSGTESKTEGSSTARSPTVEHIDPDSQEGDNQDGRDDSNHNSEPEISSPLDW